MNLICSKKSWLTAPIIALFYFAMLLFLWSVIETQPFAAWFSIDDAFAPVELMTLPLFALIIPLVWLCPPQSGSSRRQCAWAALWSVLSIVAIVRETDIHKIAFAQIWPDIANSFHGTVFKMRFLKADGIPFMPKLFVLAFFIVFFVVVLLPLLRYFIPLMKGFSRFEPVAWSTATFGGVSVVVLIIDRLPANLRHANISVSDSLLALMKAFEEGGEMLMALLALLALLQSHLLFGRKSAE